MLCLGIVLEMGLRFTEIGLYIVLKVHWILSKTSRYLMTLLSMLLTWDFIGPLLLSRFQPFSKAHQNRSYERMLHTSSSFQPVPYGTKYFREEHQENLQGKQVPILFSLCMCFPPGNSCSSHIILYSLCIIEVNLFCCLDIPLSFWLYCYLRYESVQYLKTHTASVLRNNTRFYHEEHSNTTSQLQLYTFVKPDSNLINPCTLSRANAHTHIHIHTITVLLFSASLCQTPTQTKEKVIRRAHVAQRLPNH